MHFARHKISSSIGQIRLSQNSSTLCLMRKWSTKSSPDLPDYNTDINVHEHKLNRPVAKPASSGPGHDKDKWKGLLDLKARTKTSLIPDTLKEMDENEEFKITAAELKRLGQKKLTREERKKRQRALDYIGIPDFLEFWKEKKLEQGIEVQDKILRKNTVELMQVNIGLYCNQACNHCHVESSPRRKEMMNKQTAERCIHVLKNSPNVHTLDITGGAPELNDEFRHLAVAGRQLNKSVIVRSNLTSLLEPGQEDTVQFFADNELHVAASLPCYSAKNVNTQRGSGVFDRSIHALLMLNEAGYGKPGTGLHLDLVYNPLGAFLPPPQQALEDKYKEELQSVFGICFNRLFTVTNMPIKRFADFLYRRNELNDYMELLVRNYNLDTVDSSMCRNHLSVNWNGDLYDCDFNQQLDLRIADSGKRTIYDIESCSDLEGAEITVDNHCYGCTAGMGSS
ncbi:uncharacterized protein LOC132733287 [Ruditapes philippinarum]|uniref:uncharacterized protein LOC132733287 n=1 Tax=Ruditapes philippinarum TaxID=129788 RepID=UPI00295AF9F2|nr:uncharacterized protein LOC132733287 [Ruditapes philippinarum]